MAHDPVPGSGEPRTDEGRDILREWPAWLILAALWVGSLLVEPRLPARVPMHWGLHGEVNGWGTPWEAAWLLPALATGVYGFVLLLDWGRLDFRAARRMAPGTTRQMRLLLLALMAGIQAVILGSALRGSTPGDGLLLAFLALFLVLLALILVPLGAGTCYAYVLRHRMAAGGILPPEAR